MPSLWSGAVEGAETGMEAEGMPQAVTQPQKGESNHQLERDLPHLASRGATPFLATRAAGGDGGVFDRPVGGTISQGPGGGQGAQIDVRTVCLDHCSNFTCSYSDATATSETPSRMDAVSWLPLAPTTHHALQHEWAAEISRCSNVEEGRAVHARIVAAARHTDVYLCNLVIHMFGRCGSSGDARRVFATIRHPNDHSWTLLLGAYIQSGNVEAAKQVLDAMPRPNVVAWTLLLQGYADKGHLEAAKATFDAMPEPNIISWTAMLALYGSNGNVEAAHLMFDGMPQYNLVSWNALLFAYAASGHGEKAERLFNAMPEHNLQSWCSMMSAFNEAGNGERAAALFQQMPGRDVVAWNSLLRARIVTGDLDAAKTTLVHYMPQHNLISWNTYMSGLAQHGAAGGGTAAAAAILDEAAGVFDAIPEWNVVTVNSMLSCYSQAGRLGDARQLFDCLGGRQDLVLHTTMFVAYAQRGHLEEAKVLFDKLPYCSLVSWNAMVVAYGQSEDVHGAHRLFSQAPHRNVATWNALLSVYARNGHLWAARALFDVMPARDLLSWNTMLAAYAHLGGDDECERGTEVVTSMAWEGTAPDEVSYLCLLVVCNHFGLLHTGCRYFASMASDYGLQPGKEHYSAMAGILGRLGLVHEAEGLITLMPCAADAVSWTALLGACHIHPSRQQLRRAHEAAKKVAALEPHSVAPHILLSAIAAPHE
ncbi:pentatricopeptide repeat-containing protein At2g35030, mitochondrial [Selaginella moellendorffii]|uniref:pentatricopeptide repeat-containing protein At2g35030, mitochondrial n=1 Tax=Selaginella moellendorffii TaxID=88036 RepID=UPI000D1D01D9|nr:pentatricopeptide repeat-containing protein At2g35030, mitochondrial [Selaginella moellendorffii]|eukprot:XP_024518552.1 pentatricopeptide repeat-containing protein At2g35030, mitochondrial [Selaginella moellendorffii]